MEKLMKISEEISVGPQPSVEELKDLKHQGFQTIVNFRTEGEEDQPLTPEAEGKKVRELGLEYLHIPVSTEEIKSEQVDQFRQRFDGLPKPVYGHCNTGKRSGAFAMMHIASERGVSGEETIQAAHDMGFECDKPELVEFVRRYVDGHSAV